MISELTVVAAGFFANIWVALLCFLVSLLGFFRFRGGAIACFWLRSFRIFALAFRLSLASLLNKGGILMGRRGDS